MIGGDDDGVRDAADEFGAAHLGAVAILAKVVPSRWSGTGQGLFAASIGLQMAAGIAVSGTLFQSNPHAPFYLMAAFAAAGTAVTFLLTPLIRKQLSLAGSE